MIEAAFAWLRGNIGRLDDDRVIVHGDYDLRNILVAEGHISAVLDWEMSRLGHRAEDLGYFRNEAGRGIDWADFIDAYQEAGAAPINPSAVAYFDVWAWLWRVVIVVTAYSGYYRGEHGNFLYGSTRFVEYEDHLDKLADALHRARS